MPTLSQPHRQRQNGPRFSGVFLACLLAAVLILAACKPAAPKGDCGPGALAFYLTAETRHGADMPRTGLEKVELSAEPIIAPDEILSYSVQTFELRLAPAAMQRLAALKVPTNGIGFVACSQGKPVFSGAFWTPISSLSYDGIAMMVPLDASWPAVRLDPGYPGGMSALRDDPRSDPNLLKALEDAGKLR